MAKRVIITPDPDSDTTSAVAQQLGIVVFGTPVEVPGERAYTVPMQILRANGQPYDIEHDMEMAVYQDEGLGTPALNASIGGPSSKGAIDDGEGLAAIKLSTDANGEFDCKVSSSLGQTVHAACKMGFGSASVNCQNKLELTFPVNPFPVS